MPLFGVLHRNEANMFFSGIFFNLLYNIASEKKKGTQVKYSNFTEEGF